MSESEPEVELDTPFGSFLLRRWPLIPHDNLRAWDAADELMLNYVAENIRPGGRMLIVNDTHGALATVLNERMPTSWGDSAVSFLALSENIKSNQIAQQPVMVPSTEVPSGSFDIVLIRVPKATALLTDQLLKLRPLLRSNSVVVAGAMVKHLQKSAFAAFENYIGPVTTSLAVKKARLVFSTFVTDLDVKAPPASVTYTDPDVGFALTSLPNVFSQDRLDHGARFFMSRFAELPQARQVIDLGCGNGVLGIYLQTLRNETCVTYIDESFAAVDSAQINHQRVFAVASHNTPQATFIAGNGLDSQSESSADLILCNPPFHQQHVVGQQIALAMFKDSKRVLRQGGQLWVVANRHLDYPAKLKRMFGRCTTVASNNKFCIYKITQR
jgi:16S rRNA (guanine1207-N2)-methyltransferase